MLNRSHLSRMVGASRESVKLAVISTITPISTPIIYNDQGSGPAGGAPSYPNVNTTANLASSRYYRLSLKDEIDGDIAEVKTREVRISDFRIYKDNVQYLLPEKLTAAEIEYPGFKSFIMNISNLSTSTTYALVARELDESENAIVDSYKHIIKWIKSKS